LTGNSELSGDFLCRQFHLEPRIAFEAIETQASDIHVTLENLLRKLDRSVSKFADLIRKNATY